MEQWLVIEDFPCYEISSEGRVRNIGTKRILKPSRHPGNGLLYVPLREDMKQHNRSIHRLVANAFLYPQPEGCVPVHLNGDRYDNSAKNLDWKTLSQARELTHERGRTNPVDRRRVRMIREDRIFEHALEAAQILGGLEKHVLFAAGSDATVSYKGSHWEFVIS